MNGSSKQFHEDVSNALADGSLRGALRKATDLFDERRGRAVASVGAAEFERLRCEARAIKDRVLGDLDRYLDRFIQNAERRGVIVHRAADAEQACAIVAAIAREQGAEGIVKSKSMTTEEIDLNAYLEAQGLHPVETDLGEWIIQLAEERPSHIIVPAIHKTRRQIAELFAEHLNTDPDLDAEALTEVARRFMRGRFAAADLGITGANFLVAETGSILLLENEGNIRLTTSLPRVHVAVVGIEKVIPELQDLAVFLRLLPRSGTGQHLTSYQSILTGTSSDDAVDGPSCVHVILLDNGRSKMLANEHTRASLACIRCGACLNVCPVYQQIGGHAYGSVYPGPIGAIISPQLDGLPSAGHLPFASSLCGACRDVCPVKIDIPAVLLHLRGEVNAVKKSRTESLAFALWSRVTAGPRRFAAAALAARLLQRLGLIGLLPPARIWKRQRELRPLARRSFRQTWRRELSRSGPAETVQTVQIPETPETPATGHQASEPAPSDGPASSPAEATDLLEEFECVLRGVGGFVHRVADREAARRKIQTLVPSSAVISDAPLLTDLGLEFSADDLRAERLLEVECGITTAQFAIAETGTLVLVSKDERHRLVSLLPGSHLAVLRRSDILPRLEDALAAIATDDLDAMSQCVTFVTGPSRTADIELTLVVGVHGPKRLDVLVLEGE